jgi:pimeloyl-ACP methyl ester carboxylesterase
MNFFLKRPIPGTGGGGAGFATERKPGDPSVFPLVKILEAYDPAFDPRPTFLTADEMAAFVETFERTGFTGGINWYRNMTRNWERSEAIVDKVIQPSLMVMAELDAVLPPSAADGMGAYVADLEKALITGSGHWTQQEKPEETSRVILDWLGRRFPG